MVSVEERVELGAALGRGELGHRALEEGHRRAGVGREGGLVERAADRGGVRERGGERGERGGQLRRDHARTRVSKLGGKLRRRDPRARGAGHSGQKFVGSPPFCTRAARSIAMATVSCTKKPGQMERLRMASVPRTTPAMIAPKVSATGLP